MTERMTRGRGVGEEALQLFDDVKSMAMELDATWQMFIVPILVFFANMIRSITSKKDKKAQADKHRNITNVRMKVCEIFQPSAKRDASCCKSVHHFK